MISDRSALSVGLTPMKRHDIGCKCAECNIAANRPKYDGFCLAATSPSMSIAAGTATRWSVGDR